jgi:hypothetical protein
VVSAITSVVAALGNGRSLSLQRSVSTLRREPPSECESREAAGQRNARDDDAPTKAWACVWLPRLEPTGVVPGKPARRDTDAD